MRQATLQLDGQHLCLNDGIEFLPEGDKGVPRQTGLKGRGTVMSNRDQRMEVPEGGGDRGLPEVTHNGTLTGG